MSDTDRTRPVWVQRNDHRSDVVVAHSYRCHESGGAACDLPAWPVDQCNRDTGCSYPPAGELWQHIYVGSCLVSPGRKRYRRAWFASERAAQRAILRGLTRDATCGGEVDEDRIDNRQTHRHAEYGGGWCD
ncbi:MAG: hypothetical protein ACRDUS_11740 [Mycobacterium sp.]